VGVCPKKAVVSTTGINSPISRKNNKKRDLTKKMAGGKKGKKEENTQLVEIKGLWLWEGITPEKGISRPLLTVGSRKAIIVFKRRGTLIATKFSRKAD